MIFDIWQEEWKRNKLQRSYDKSIKDLQKAKKHKDAADLREEAAHYIGEADERLEFLRSRKLVKKAIKLQVPRPDFKDETLWTQWGEYGYVLTDIGYYELRSRIMKFQSERLEYRMRWVKLVLIPLGTFILERVSKIGSASDKVLIREAGWVMSFCHEKSTEAVNW